MVTRSGADRDRMTSHDWSIWLPPARTLWTLEEAACLVHGYKPSAFSRHLDAVNFCRDLEDFWRFPGDFPGEYVGDGKTRVTPHGFVRWYVDTFGYKWQWETSDPKHVKWPTHVRIPGPWLPKPLEKLLTEEPAVEGIPVMGPTEQPHGNRLRGAYRDGELFGAVRVLLNVWDDADPPKFRNEDGTYRITELADALVDFFQEKIWGDEHYTRDTLQRKLQNLAKKLENPEKEILRMEE